MRHGPPFLLLLPLFAIYTAFKFHQIFKLKWIGSILATLGTFVLMLGWLFLYRSGQLVQWFGFDSPWLLALTWVGSLVLSLWVMFTLLSFAYDIFLTLAWLVRKIFRASPVDQRRREIFLRWAPAGILGASGVMSGVGLFQAMHGPQIKEVDLKVPGLPANLAGLKIAQFSDLHISPLINNEYVTHVVDAILALQPDMIVFTGDVADGTPEELAKAVTPLKRLKAPLGTYYITGNHEYYWGVDEWIAAMKDVGMEPFINQSKIINYKDTEFLLGGVTDTSGGNFSDAHISDPHKAMGGHKNIPFKLLLAHRPESCVKAQQAAWNVQLSGHTHAGQFFPFNLFMPFSHQYYKGLNKHKNLLLYVNAGTGFWGPPQRFAVPSEITLLKLEVQGADQS